MYRAEVQAFALYMRNGKKSTCTVGSSKDAPTSSSIRKIRAIALLRLLMHPHFAH